MITGKTKLAGVVGWPVGHSLSPMIHNHWIAEAGVDAAYVPLPVKPDDFETAIRGLQAAGFVGVNVTIPHKEAAFRLCDEIDEAGAAIKAINTLFFEEDGRITGWNTDYFGFMRSATSAIVQCEHAVVLGAGGSARAILYGLAQCGTKRATILNRTKARAEALASEFSIVNMVCEAGDWEDFRVLSSAELIVNTTSLGMTGQPPLPVRAEDLPQGKAVVDIIYTPLKTPLLEAAEQRGCRIKNGLPMLIAQAHIGAAVWFGIGEGKDPDLLARLEQTLREQEGRSRPCC